MISHLSINQCIICFIFRQKITVCYKFATIMKQSANMSLVVWTVGRTGFLTPYYYSKRSNWSLIKEIVAVLQSVSVKKKEWVCYQLKELHCFAHPSLPLSPHLLRPSTRLHRVDGVMRTMNTEKLLKTIPIIQNQMDALLDFNVSLRWSLLQLWHAQIALRLLQTMSRCVISVHGRCFSVSTNRCEVARR